jgi:hypothetical protein
MNNIIKNSTIGGQSGGKALPLTGWGVKIIGITLMVMDHLHQMFINQGAPAWLSWFGRPVATMFIFLCAEGFFYTRNRGRYVLRFLGAFILMNLANRLLTEFFPVENVELINNVFGALFMSVFYMLVVDLFRRGIKEKKPGRILLSIGGALLPFVIGMAFAVMVSGDGDTPLRTIALTLFFLIPTPLTVEGGFLLVIIGMAFFLLRNHRWAQALVPVAAGLLILFTSRGETGLPNPQWLMVFAALPILLYNGRRGRGGKYFFYAFYPGHIYLLYLIAWFLQTR